MTKETNQPEPEKNTVRVIRVSRIFGCHPASVLIHTADGRRHKLKMTEPGHINTDTGALTSAGWHFIDSELTRLFGCVEWSEKTE